MCLIWLANGLAMIIVKLQDNTVIVLYTCEYMLSFTHLPLVLSQLQPVTTVQSMFQPFISDRHSISWHLLSVFCSHLSYSCLHPSPSLFVTCTQLFFTYCFYPLLYFRCSPTVHALTKIISLWNYLESEFLKRKGYYHFYTWAH